MARSASPGDDPPDPPRGALSDGVLSQAFFCGVALGLFCFDFDARAFQWVEDWLVGMCRS